MDYMVRGSASDSPAVHGAVSVGAQMAQLVVVGEVIVPDAITAKAAIDAVVAKHGGHHAVQRKLQELVSATLEAWPRLSAHSKFQSEHTQR